MSVRVSFIVAYRVSELTNCLCVCVWVSSQPRFRLISKYGFDLFGFTFSSSNHICMLRCVRYPQLISGQTSSTLCCCNLRIIYPYLCHTNCGPSLGPFHAVVIALVVTVAIASQVGHVEHRWQLMQICCASSRGQAAEGQCQQPVQTRTANDMRHIRSPSGLALSYTGSQTYLHILN